VTPQEHHLLTTALLDKHWVLFTPCDGSSSEHQANLVQQGSRTSSSSISSEEDQAPSTTVDPVITLNEESFSRDLVEGEGVETEESQIEAAIAASLSLYRKTCSRNINKFDRLNFNVVDPFTCSNVIVERMTPNRVVRLSKVFKGGAQQISSLLSEVLAGDPSHPTYRLLDPHSLPEVTVLSTLLHAKIQTPQQQTTHINSIIKLAFPGMWSKYGGTMWRADTWNAEILKNYPPQVLAQLAREKCSLDIGAEASEHLSRHVYYSNLMVESIISRVSLLDLVMEILEHKGPLPIGEVGKALAELTCISGLSLRLKEKYGGLKKFLEEYSAIIIIGNDHPFNPHVVLRCSLTVEQQNMVDRGQFPTQAVIKMKKVTINSLKRIAGSKAAVNIIPPSGYNQNNLVFFPSGMVSGSATPLSSMGGSHSNKQLSMQSQRASSSAPSTHSISPRSTSPRSVSPRFQMLAPGQQIQQSQQIIQLLKDHQQKQAMQELQHQQLQQQAMPSHLYNYGHATEDMDAGMHFGYMPVHHAQGAMHRTGQGHLHGSGLSVHGSPRSKQSSPRGSSSSFNNIISGIGGGGGNTPQGHAARMELLMETDPIEMGMPVAQMNEYEYERSIALMNQQQMRQPIATHYQQQQQEQLYSQQLQRMSAHREHDMARDYASKGQQNYFASNGQSSSYGYDSQTFEQPQQLSYAFNVNDGYLPSPASNSFSFGLGSGSSGLSSDLGFGLTPGDSATSLMSGLREGTVELPDRRNRSNTSSGHTFNTNNLY